MKDLNEGLFQVIAPGITFSLIIYTDMPAGNATKAAQQLSADNQPRALLWAFALAASPGKGLVPGVEWLCWHRP